MQYHISPTNKDLQHKAHKYVDRKMGKNGKWIYYYTKKPSSLKARMGVYAKANFKNASNNYENTRGFYNYNLDRKQIERNKWALGKYFDKTGAGEEKNKQDNINRLNAEIDAIKGAKQKRATAARNAAEAYLNSPIGKIDSASENIKKAYHSGVDYLKKKLGIS